MFLLRNNGTLTAFPSRSFASATSYAALPTVNYIWLVNGPLAYAPAISSAPFFLSSIHLWAQSVWILRVFPDSSLGPLQRFRDHVEAPYGNIYEDIVDPFVLFNGTRATIVYTSFTKTGSEDGIDITEYPDDPPVAPNNPPVPASLPAAISGGFTSPPGYSFRFAALITYGVDFSSVDLLLSWFDFDGLRDQSLRLVGSRALMLAYLPDWRERPPSLLVEYKTDVYETDYRRECRTTPLLVGEATLSFDVLMKLTWANDGFGRFWNKILRAKHRRVAIPFYTEAMLANVNAAGLDTVTVTTIRNDDLLYQSGEVCRLDSRDPHFFEVRRFVEWDTETGGPNSFSVDKPWERNIPAACQRFHFVLYGYVTKAARSSANDEHQVIELGVRSV